MYSGGGTLSGFWQNAKTVFSSFSAKMAFFPSPPRVRRGTVQIAVSRARSIKNILTGPDGPDAPSEPSGPARIFFIGRARESEV